MLESCLQRSGSPIKEIVLLKARFIIKKTKKPAKPRLRKLTSRQIAQSIARFAFDKKAEDIVILDMRRAANFCDYFVICSATSERRISGIMDGITDGLEKLGLPQKSRGSRDGKWVLLDLGDIAVHVFESETRLFYGLEYLWQDAPRIGWKR